MKTKYFFLVLAVLISCYFVIACSKDNSNGIPNGVTVEQFNNTPDKCDDLYFFIKSKKISENKLHHVYKYKVYFWDNMFSPTKHLAANRNKDIAIALDAGDGSTFIVMLTDNKPTSTYLRYGY